MTRVREKVCLWCGLAPHNLKECRKCLHKEPMRTAAQEMQLQQPMGKTRSKTSTKQKPQVAIREPLDRNQVFVQVNGHPVLALIDLQTLEADHILQQFVYLYILPVAKIESKTLATAIKGSKGPVDKTCEVELNCGGYAEISMFYVEH